jgi:hypothetical protein
MSAEFRVPLNPLEKLFHNLHDQLGGTGTSAAIARYPVRIDPDRFRAATHKMQQVHPALRAVIRPDAEGRPCWELPDPPPPIPVAFLDDDDPLAAEKLAFADVDLLFDAANEPQVRFTVVRPRTGDYSEVVATVHHSLYDGRTLMKTYTELADCYADPDAARPEVPWARGSRIKKLPIGVPRAVANVAGRIGQNLLSRFRPPAHAPVEASGARRLRKLILSAEQTAALVRRAREENSSVYGALAAAMLHSSGELFNIGDRRMSVRSAMDMRTRYDPPLAPDALGCYVDSVRTIFKAPARRPFWDLARRCRQKVQAGFNRNEAYWKSKLLGRFGFNAERQKKLPGETVVVNNLGVIGPAPPGSPLQMQEFCWVTNAHRIRGGGLMLEVVTVADRLNLTFRSEGQSFETLDRLAENFRERLLKNVGA